MEIRRAREVDAPAITDAFLGARAAMSYLPVLHTSDETRAFLRDVVLRQTEVWVAECEGRVAGFVALRDQLVDHLYVAPEAQGRGIGAALIELAKQQRPRGLELWVFQRNDGARRFYQRHGFELVELTDGHANEEREPDARYAWRPATR